METGDHRGQQVGEVRAHHMCPQDEAQQDEGELPALGQAHGGGERDAVGMPEKPSGDVHGQRLQDHQPQHQPRDGEGVRGHQGQIQPRPDGDEEETQEQAAERLDVGLELAAELAFRQHHACQEGAERRGEPDQLHQGRDRDHQQQGRGGEDFPQARGGDEAEERLGEVAPAGHDDGDCGHLGERLGPAGKARQEVRVMVRRRRHDARGRQQRQEGEERDHRQVLKQQDPEGSHADRALAQALFLQALQDDGRGRHGQDQAHRGPGPPVQPERQGRPARSRTPVPRTWARPTPKIAVRIFQSSAGRTSSPIRNSRITTPELAELLHLFRPADHVGERRGRSGRRRSGSPAPSPGRAAWRSAPKSRRRPGRP